MDDTEFEIVNNKREKADIWTWFRLKRQKVDAKIEESVAVYYKCNKKVKYSGGTINLGTHFRRHHSGTLMSSASHVAISSAEVVHQLVEFRRIFQASHYSFSSSATQVV